MGLSVFDEKADSHRPPVHSQACSTRRIRRRGFFGTAGLPITKAEYAQRIETREAWNDVSVEAQGNLAPVPAG